MDTKKGVEKSLEVLEKKMHLIDRVTEWANECGFKNPKTFSRLFRNHFGKRPKEMMLLIKVKRAIELLSNGQNHSNYEIAKAIGKRDEQALFHLIYQQTGHPPSYYKKSEE